MMDAQTDDRAKIISPNHNGGDLICLAQFPDAAYQALRSLALWVQRSFLKEFYHIQVCRPSSSCDVAHLSKLSFTHPMEPPHEIQLQLASKEMSFENVDRSTTHLYYKL